MAATTRGRVFGAVGLLTTLIVLLFGVALTAHAQGPGGIDPDRVPGELEPWIDWVRERDAPTGDCRNVSGTVICIWPTQVELVLDDEGGSFTLEVTAHGQDTVELPGDDGAWPQEVTVDGRPALVMQNGGVPFVELDDGRHRVEGRYLWRSLPGEIALPSVYALVDLTVRGTTITFPPRTDGALDLPESPKPEDGPHGEPDPDADPEPDPDEDPDAEPEPDSETIEVSRLVADGVPLVVTTRIDLRVSGSERELVLPYPLWDDAKLLRIDSGLPVTLNEDRALEIEARPGSYVITLLAHLPRAPESLGPPQDLAKPWPDEEIWVWHAMTGPEAQGLASVGQVALKGGTPVDRTRTHAPTSWPGGATYKVTAKTPLTFEVLQRGVSQTAQSDLVLSREAILDLDGDGWFLGDTIAGTLRGTTRLDLEAGTLGAVVVDDAPQVVTVGAQGHGGVELRNPDVRLRADWRADGRDTIPLAGWSEDFDRVSLEFRLPRGWDILRASGPGRMSETWVDRWQNPLDIVLILLCCVAVGLWVDWRVALVTLAGLVLVYSPRDDAFIALLVLIGMTAGLKKLMERELAPWLAWGARSAWMLSVGLLVAWVALFLPDGLHRVWTEGAPAFGDIRFERAFETLFGFAFAAVLFAAFVSGVSWGIGRLRGVPPRIIVPSVVVVFVLVLGIAFVNGGGRELGPMSQLGDAEMAKSDAPPPPVDEEPEVEEEYAAAPEPAAGEADKRDYAKEKKRAASPAYAMEADDGLAEEQGWDDLTGSEVDEAYGVGGLGLNGTGRGGGGTGEGTIGRDKGGFGGPGKDAAAAEPTRYVEGDLPEAPPPEIPQTGRAAPDWTGRVWTVDVDRTVESGEALSLTLLSPTANKVIALLRALALAFMAVAMVRLGWPRLSRPPAAPKSGTKTNTAAAAATAVCAVWLGAAGVAQAAPPQDLLDELSKRVNAEPELAPSPTCGQACALVPLVEVDVDPDRLAIDIEVHMAGPGVYALPGSIATWSPTQVMVDKKPARALVARGGQILVHLPEGLHELSLRGPIAGDLLNLSLSTPPKRVEVNKKGWSVRGVDERDTATNLVFTRQSGTALDPGDDPGPISAPDPDPASQQPSDDAKRSQDLPVWLSVQRVVEIGPRWTMRTTVRRLNEGPSPVTIRVPLLEGEKMIESSEKIDDPKATVTLDRNGEAVTWTSVLETRELLELAAPADGAWTETWLLECGAAWQCDAQGLPPTSKNGASSVYHPWPGESLKVALFKPSPAEGARVSVDGARLDLSVGDAGTRAVLTATVRSSTVGERTITLPPEAHLEVVEVDGSEVPTAKDAQQVRLTFQPGTHDVRIEWKQDGGFASTLQTPEVSFDGEVMNAKVTLRFEDDHDPVILWTSGDGRGPVVWFWAWVLALVGLAVFMQWLVRGRGELAQHVRLHDWFLLGLGFDIVVLPVVYAWFLLVGQRRDLTKSLPGDDAGDRRYNALQMVTVLLTALVVIVTLATAQQLLTSRVDTMVDNLFSSTTLSWYVDQSDGALPRGYVLSIHPGLWRVVWIAWLAWFGWRAYTWAKWSFGEVGEGGWLRWPPPPTVADAGEVVEQIDGTTAPAEALSGERAAADAVATDVDDDD